MFKVPKKVIIGGKEWKVKQDNKVSGGSFQSGKGEIIIGGKYEGDVPFIFLHEVVEAILAEKLLRYHLYKGDDNEEFIFVFNHKEMSQFGNALAIALKDVLK